MAGLIPFNGRNGLRTGLDGFYNMIDDFFAANWPIGRGLMGDTFKIDVSQTDTEYLVEAELPGVKKDELDVTLSDGTLTIAVQREESINEEKKNFIHKERRYSSMSRSVYLPEAKEDGIRAKLNDGVLKINVQKRDDIDKSKRIVIE